MLDFIYQGAALAAEGLNFDSAARVGTMAGNLLWHTLPGRRRVAVTQVSERLDLPLDEARTIAKASFQHTGRSFFEVFLTKKVDWRFLRERVSYAQPELFEAMLADPAPVVLSVAHLGAWELLAGLMNLRGRPRAMAVVVREGKDKAMNWMLKRQRQRSGGVVIGHRNAAMPVLRVLRKGGFCGFLVDHNTMRREAVFLPFLGKTAAVNAGPALLALRAGAAVWPMFMLRAPGNYYVMEMLPPLRTSDLQGEQEQKIRDIASFYTGAVESMVRRYPEQWLWMHKRWKTRPEGE